ncbi:MAG: LysR family transcriptional regulator [Actinomyces sp.]|jgi:DNA-binding transcriptional LysR family regulator|nr:LysR family transcriptional regulator [Actinomyces sp.]
MDTRLLEYFVSVATEEGILRAADELSTAQSTVSSGIHRLERELGTALFATVGRRLQLTEAGNSSCPSTCCRAMATGSSWTRSFRIRASPGG